MIDHVASLVIKTAGTSGMVEYTYMMSMAGGMDTINQSRAVYGRKFVWKIFLEK